MKFSLVALFAASAIAAPQLGGGKGKTATGVPSFPTGFPSGIPSGFPTGFPTGIPSGFPTGFPTGSGFPFPTGGFPGGEDEDESLFNVASEDDEAASARPTGKGKGTGKPTGFPTGLPSGIPTGFPTGPGGPIPTGRPGGDE